ncbi:Sec-independent protein translocase protein TatB [Caulobacter sp. NIBR1757]|uniref:Sec-independent protein translocase protein TatB n=1 Tax=Caulobacter sp. NIBR1757 TaxID=3016000 RepID=UPI0022F01E65|nr:Sec-independent protein translocase protein TatB [Caulobacter sp. NIBR1757]WGM38668.1 Sec-independent protein translocase protein TatB [Caulobacter sp. NIBR1757]
MLSPDIGVSEMILVAAIALIVVGPKDLPLLMRRVGQFIARLRGMANEFRASFEDMARQSELEDLRKEVEAMRSGQFAPTIHDPNIDQVFAEIDSGLKTGQVSLSPAITVDPPAEPEATKPARKPRAKAAPKAEADLPPPAPRKRVSKKAIVEGGEAAGGIVQAPKRKRARKTGTVS